MSEEKFRESKNSLAFSQSLLDKMRMSQNVAQQGPEMGMDVDTPVEEMIEETPEEVVEKPVVEEPTTEVIETQEEPTPKSIQETVEDLSNTIGTGFEALDKAAATLKEVVATKRRGISKRIKERLSSKEDKKS